MRYTLKNSKLKAEFDSFGAELLSLKDDMGKEYLWYGDDAFWARRSPILFPFVGKVRDGKYRYKGTEYTMGQHGFARDKEFALVSQTDEELWFVLEADNETRKIYPFEFRLVIGYRLVENKLKVMWRVLNLSDTEPLYFSIGAHPGFLCPIEEGTKQSEYSFQFDVSEPVYHTASMENGLRLPYERILKTEHGKCQITDSFFDMGQEGTYIFENNQIKEVSLLRPDGRPYVTVRFDMPMVALWSPEKKQAPFVCIEPWYGRCDAVDFDGSLEERVCGNSILPDEVFETAYEICIIK